MSFCSGTALVCTLYHRRSLILAAIDCSDEDATATVFHDLDGVDASKVPIGSKRPSESSIRNETNSR